jgi:hypothetical protein
MDSQSNTDKTDSQMSQESSPSFSPSPSRGFFRTPVVDAWSEPTLCRSKAEAGRETPRFSAVAGCGSALEAALAATLEVTIFNALSAVTIWAQRPKIARVAVGRIAVFVVNVKKRSSCVFDAAPLARVPVTLNDSDTTPSGAS